MTSKTVNIRIIDRIAGQYAIYGLDDVILNTEGLMQMRYNIVSCSPFMKDQLANISIGLFADVLLNVRQDHRVKHVAQKCRHATTFSIV